METSVVNEFESMKDEMGNIEFNTGALSLPDYIEKWRILLWEKTFMTIMKGNPPFIKFTQLTKVPGVDSIIKRILYRLDIVMQFGFYFTYHYNLFFMLFNYESSFTLFVVFIFR